MEVKEAIEIITEDRNGNRRMDIREADEIISLLQDLEKHREYWEQAKNRFRAYCFNRSIDVMELIEQDYEPQPVKKVITIEVEAKDKSDMNWIIESFKDDVENINSTYKGEIKVNIKEEK